MKSMWGELTEQVNWRNLWQNKPVLTRPNIYPAGQIEFRYLCIRGICSIIQNYLVMRKVYTYVGGIK